MLKKVVTFLCFFAVLSAFSQETIQLKGRIVADSLQGSSINIVNLSQKIGTSNYGDGTFEIAVQESDTLFFSSVQFKNIQVQITPEIYKSGHIEVELKESVNELAEVKVFDTDLTGVAEKDIESVKIYELPVNLNGAMVDGMKFDSDWHDPLAKPVNLALGESSGPNYSANVLGILGLALSAIPHKDKVREKPLDLPTGEMNVVLLKIFDKDFFTRDLHIAEDHIHEFIFYCQDNGLEREMLQDEKRLDLVQFLISKSKIYLALNEKNRGQLQEN